MQQPSYSFGRPTILWTTTLKTLQCWPLEKRPASRTCQPCLWLCAMYISSMSRSPMNWDTNGNNLCYQEMYTTSLISSLGKDVEEIQVMKKSWLNCMKLTTAHSNQAAQELVMIEGQNFCFLMEIVWSSVTLPIHCVLRPGRVSR